MRQAEHLSRFFYLLARPQASITTRRPQSAQANHRFDVFSADEMVSPPGVQSCVSFVLVHAQPERAGLPCW
jgi:hypothetical protein